MYIKKIILENFRNFKSRIFEFPDSFIVFEGNNGIGKTNLLESIYLLCTGKSQRKSKREEMINFNSDSFFVEGNFVLNDTFHNVGLSYSRDRKISFFLEQIVQRNFFDWFGRRPAVSFNSEDILLITGSPEIRRKFLDLFGCYTDSSYLHSLISYRYWIQRKNALLRRSFDEIQCQLYDEQISSFASEIILKRYELIEYINRFFNDLYQEISNNSDKVIIEYESSLDLSKCSKNSCKNVFYNNLVSFRTRDREAGFSTFGPHRDDLKIFFNGKVSRKFASQGQCRLLSLSLKLSSSFSLEEIFGERSIFLIDDSVAELDANRLDRFFSIIQNRSQIFLATPLGRLSFNKNYSYIDVSDKSL